MSTLSCPSCGVRLRVPEGRAKPKLRGNCPGCGARIVLRAAAGDGEGEGDGDRSPAPHAPAAPPRPAASARAPRPTSSADLPVGLKETDGPVDPLIGKSIGRYLVQRRVGRGAGSVVYAARDTGLNRAVALKLLTASEIRAGGAVSVERFVREARAAGRLIHPNVVSVYDVGTHEGIPFIAMQLVADGGPPVSKEGEALDPLEATRIIRGAALGLAAAHAAGIVHRDVKPGNILVGRGDGQGREVGGRKGDAGNGGEVRVTDFGLARLLDNQAAALTEPGQALGTPQYMSPEQCTGTPADHRSDVYSLGATYYRLLTGRAPFTDPDPMKVMYRQVTAPHPDPQSIRPGVPGICVRVIDRAMEKAPDRRYQSMAEMAEALRAVEESLRRDAERLDEQEVVAILDAESEELDAIDPTSFQSVDVLPTLGRGAVKAAAMPVAAPASAASAKPAGSKPVGSKPAAAAAAPPKPEPPPPAAPATGPAPVTLRIGFPGDAQAQEALGYLRADVRSAAEVSVGPPKPQKGKPAKREAATVLEVTLRLDRTAALGVLKTLLFAGGEHLSADSTEPGASDWFRKQAAALSAAAKRPASKGR